MNLFSAIGRRLDLKMGTDVDATIARIGDEANLSPENIWLLVASAILASIGLDLSSVAVIIGAMLISPLMGPILGVGMGLGITDRTLLQRSLRELGIATVIAIIASTVYFLISPLAIPTPEMVARTRPTLLDVGVAFFGGVAGIVAGSRRKQTLALPGVAIATALMPPLCTAGFGLATGNWGFFFGSFYLYALNAIFITLSTLLVIRFLHFPYHHEATPEARRRERRLVALVAIIATLPSMYFLYVSVRSVREERRITGFVHEKIEGPGRSAPQWEHHQSGDADVLKVYVAGRPIDSLGVDSLRAALTGYGLATLQLEIVQSDISAEDLQRFQGNVQRDILRAVAAARGTRDSANQLRLRQDSLRVSVAARELASAFPEIAGARYVARLDLLAPDSVRSPPAMYLQFAAGTGSAARRGILRRAQALLRQRLGLADLLAVER